MWGSILNTIMNLRILTTALQRQINCMLSKEEIDIAMHAYYTQSIVSGNITSSYIKQKFLDLPILCSNPVITETKERETLVEYICSTSYYSKYPRSTSFYSKKL